MIFDHLKSDINSLTYFELVSEIDKLGLQYIPAYPILKDMEINRARPTYGLKFDNIKQLSYNPWPESFGRANTPCYPMFYGAIKTNDSDIPLVTNFAEVNEILRDLTDYFNEQEISVAEFVVKENFDAGAIIFSDEFVNINSQFIPLYELVKEQSKRLQNKDFEILTYFSDMLSYSNKNKNFDYRITAGIANWLLETNPRLGGIIYPSVRLGGEGTNIAIKPEIVNSKLKCIRVFTTKIYLKKKCCINDLINVSDRIEDDGSFNLIDIDKPPLPLGREKCLEILESMINDKKAGHNSTH